MAAYLSMASFIPIGLPIFINHHSASARLLPTTTNTSYDIDSEPPSYTSTGSSQTQTQTSSTTIITPDQTTTHFQGTGSESDFKENTKAKMSIFASQSAQAPFSNSVPPPSYTKRRQQPPSYSPSTSASASPSTNRTWLYSLFNLSSSPPPLTPLPTPPPPETQVQKVNLTPLPPCYKPSGMEQGMERQSTSSNLTITSQPGQQELPRYSSIISSSTLSPTSTATTSSSSGSSQTSTSSPKKPKKSVSWIPPPSAADDAMYEEYELRRKAEREGRESEWCCGCFWVGPAHPWQAYYVY